MHDAREKARSYARNLGLGDVRPVAIADVGMLGESATDAQPTIVPRMALAAGATPMDDSTPELNLIPQDITVTAAVDARFVAS
ncbi:MAG: SIMPL domain-containing protein [Jatrophihabitantaceae bacterium]